MTREAMRHRLAWVLEYEPTWFPEFGSGLGAILWSLFAYMTDDIAIHGWAWCMPATGLFLLGPMRWVLLFRLRYTPRVLAAVCSAAWWGWIICGAGGRYGAVPMEGGYAVPFAMDLLTIARFSIPCLRDLLTELAPEPGPHDE